MVITAGGRFVGPLRANALGQFSEAHDGRIVGLLSGEHQTQRDERQIGSPGTQTFEACVKRSGAGTAYLRLEQSAHEIAL